MSAALGTVLLLLALNLLNYIDRYILPGAQPLIQREFHSTDQQMGALTTALFFFYMFAAPASGWLGDRFRRKPLIIIGAILWSLATLGSAFVHSYWSLYTRRALVGVGEATFGIFAPAVLVRPLSRAGAQPHSLDLLSGHSRRRCAGLPGWRGTGHIVGMARAIPHLRNSRAHRRCALRLLRPRAGARQHRRISPSLQSMPHSGAS